MADVNFTPLCVNDFERYLEKNVPKVFREYISGGSDDGITLWNNLRSWQKLHIRPRHLTGTSKEVLDTSVYFLGYKLKSPICVSPAGLQGLVSKNGEIDTVEGCKKHSNCMAVSSMSTTSYKDVKEANKNAFLGAQVDMPKTRKGLDSLIEHLESLDYNFLCLTIDMPIYGNRLHDIRNEVGLPEHVCIPNAEIIYGLGHGLSIPLDADQRPKTAEQYLNGLKLGVQWEDVRYITSRSKLPLIVKGVLTAEDAVEAVDNGASGLIVSNHGGRQLDTATCTMDALPEVVAAVDSKIPVFVDGGIRHGSDVFKALALGAKAVFVGRPIFWGLAYAGAKGVEKVLDILQAELERTMILAGCKDVSSITREHVVHEYQLNSRLARGFSSKL